ncbi:phosphatidylinositol alpha-1,6-mannosyltransferase [Rhodococcus sp. SMB37]|uniref:glycosyltransferase family 4 protein n=1 Tax=Rhodococcus sp. SMB37 TaxID=2512213 RepID=UPI0006D27AD0|nr:glycosyltransferase family 4 protein [Rhodococcus sp. SMB37]TCN57206.1 phosphatidylinositol alpha-1,6-mannosyltransferase [Rhodococcus sp. SMB37]
MKPHNRILVVTNDFPPRQGGIETFAFEMVRRFDPADVIVYTSAEPGAFHHDAQMPFRVIRDRSRMLLPTRRMARTVQSIAVEHGCDRVWFAAAAPLSSLARPLRTVGVQRIVASSHGHETWWAKLRPTRAWLRHMADGVDVFTYISDHTEAVLRSVVPDRTCFTRLSPGVDPGLFAAPKRHGPDRAHRGPVIVCVARLVRRKGQDALIRAMPMIHDRHPGTRLVLVGDGPRRRDLQALARRLGVTDVVTFVGGLPHSWIPAVLAASDIFAMPCRTRRAGFEEEGLGIVFLEASAAGLPVIAGNSGGAPETVRAGATGLVTANDAELSKALLLLLDDADVAARMGSAGREWAQSWSWDATWKTLAGLLE